MTEYELLGTVPLAQSDVNALAEMVERLGYTTIVKGIRDLLTQNPKLLTVPELFLMIAMRINHRRRDKFNNWVDVHSVLGALADELIEFHEHAPDGLSPPQFRSHLNDARLALNRALRVAQNRWEEDEKRDRAAALAEQRSNEIPELPGRLPDHLRPKGDVLERMEEQVQRTLAAVSRQR